MPSRFQRFVLPGLAFKAVVIGGGYATGRELAEYFLPAGPWYGLAAMLLSAAIWSVVCALTFHYAWKLGARDYRTFFHALLGRAWPLFEIVYIVFLILVLAVFGAAAGAIAHAVLGVAPLAGTLALMAAIAGVAAFGNRAVEWLFKYVSILLYAVYAIFLILALTTFGDHIAAAYSTPLASAPWVLGGLTYAGYNIVGAVVILPITRHLTSARDAWVAGLVAGPLAMLPAIFFFLAMTAFLPGIADEVLPSDYILQRLGSPAFHLLFQAMIFAALLESATGGVHAINERLSTSWQKRTGSEMRAAWRLAFALGLLAVCMLVADQVGLVRLIADGYRLIAYLLIAVYVIPLIVIGLPTLARGRAKPLEVL